MKNFRFYIVIFILFISFGQESLSAQTTVDSIKISTIRDYSKEFKIESKLYIKRQGKNKKVRIKEGALINCQLMDKSFTGVSTLKIITDDGLYLAPFELKMDSIDTKRKRREIIALESDTIIFIKYIDILHLNFRNQMKNQKDGAGLLLFTGGELIFAPMILTPFIYGSVENVPTKLLIAFVSAGIPFVMSGIVWKIMLRKFRTYAMYEYEFHLVKKTD